MRTHQGEEKHAEAQAPKNDFSKGSIAGNILKIGLPMIVAELVHVLYNIVDRIYIGHIEGVGTAALTGIGIALPLITGIGAFAGLCGNGGAPLCSIARGEKNDKEAAAIQETSFTMLLVIAAVLTLLFALFSDELLSVLGADAETLPFALDYFRIYLIGTVFVMIGLGMNPFINAQGFSRIGMGTVVIGAVMNLVLDPLFIFTFQMGVRGAAIATVISQMFGALWAMWFLTSKRAVLRIRRLRLDRAHVGKILALGVSGFFFRFTNSVTQAVVNTTLKIWGGAASTLLIGSMSVINSLREVVSMPISGLTQGMVPVAGYNYGAKVYRRVRMCILFTIAVTFCYNSVAMLVMQLLPAPLVGIFTEDAALIETAVPCLRVFFCVYFMMSFQATAQNVFVALNKPKFAVFFSLLRKFVLIVPLTLLLPRLGLGAMGVFWAEAFSQIIGGGACFTTMMLTVWRELKRGEAAQNAAAAV